jgi:carbohydrate ABC transporter substrate-binding protein, CUT1 family (TC 3.A.1.1.-)
VTNTIALYYRTDLLEAAGVAVPTTWEELKTAAATLTEGSQYGLAFSAIANYEATWQFLPFMWSNGAEETDLSSSEMAEAVQLWVDLLNAGSVSESVVNWTQADVNDQFMAGNAAMMINGPWQNPVLEEAGTAYAIAEIPAPSSGDTVQVPLGGEVWTLPVNSDQSKLDAAAKVIECLNTDESQLSLSTQRQTVPTRLSVQDQFVQENPQMEAYSEMISTARARTGELGAEWPDAATQIYEIVQLAMVGGKTPEEAIAQVVGG